MSHLWGKGPRQGDHSNFKRFSELSPEAKLKRRREERQEKKERDRTFSYFKSVHNILKDPSCKEKNPEILSSQLDGFFVELLRLLKADSTLHILRNGFICQVIEAALAYSLLLHSKSLLFMLLGHIQELCISPVASYLLETLIARIAQALSRERDNNNNTEVEMVANGPGLHTGSGVPSTATLIKSFVEELAEGMETVLENEIGSRTLRSIILILGGFSLRQTPFLSHPIIFYEPLGILANKTIEILYGPWAKQHSAEENEVAVWVQIPNVTTISFIIQSFLKIAEEGTVVENIIKKKIESLYLSEGNPVLKYYLLDPKGAHIFQAYIRVPAPDEVVRKGDELILREEAVMEKEKGKSAGGPDSHTHGEEKHKDNDSNKSKNNKNENNNNTNTTNNNANNDELLLQCAWGTATKMVQESVEELLSSDGICAPHAGYILQDLCLFSPTAWHLSFIGKALIIPHLSIYFLQQPLFHVLPIFFKKCAFHSLSSILAENSETVFLPPEIRTQLQKDKNQRIRFFYVPAILQRYFCITFCSAVKKVCAKGAAQFLLINKKMDDVGYELALYLLHLHPTAAEVFRGTFDKIEMEGLLFMAKDPKGSYVFQQYLRSLALTTSISSGNNINLQEGQVKREIQQQPQGHDSMGTKNENNKGLQKVLRHLSSELRNLIVDARAAFVIETLYEVSPFVIKEELVQALVPFYEEAKAKQVHGLRATENQTEGFAHCDEKGLLIARKVFTKCFVEQYIHRHDEWVKLAQRQCQIQKLVHRMSLDE